MPRRAPLSVVAIGVLLVAAGLAVFAVWSAYTASRQPASASEIRRVTLLLPPACQPALTRAVHELYADHPTKDQLRAAKKSICPASHDNDAAAGLALGLAIGSASRPPP